MNSTIRQFTMPRAAVRALLHIAAAKDIRLCLNGIYCEVTPERTMMVATNGHMLGAYRHDTREGAPNTCGAAFSIIIPRDALESIAARKTGTMVVACVAREDGLYDLTDGSTSHTFAAMDGRYPDWRRMMPRARSDGERAGDELPFAQFNPAYIAAFAKAARELGCKAAGAVRIGHRGNLQSACIEIGAEPFFGVLMPFRIDRAEVPMQAPDWCTAPMPIAPPVRELGAPDDTAANGAAGDVQAAA